MKKKLILTLGMVMIAMLAVAAVAYTRSTTTGKTAIASCCKGDSCPMGHDKAKTGEQKSCCDNCDSCKGGSCPMRSGEKMAGHHGEAMPESCPMKVKAENAVATTAEGQSAKASCCCSCCSSKTGSAAVPTV